MAERDRNWGWSCWKFGNIHKTHNEKYLSHGNMKKKAVVFRGGDEKGH